jgi:hypothetical protein
VFSEALTAPALPSLRDPSVKKMTRSHETKSIHPENYSSLEDKSIKKALGANNREVNCQSKNLTNVFKLFTQFEV